MGNSDNLRITPEGISPKATPIQEKKSEELEVKRAKKKTSVEVKKEPKVGVLPPHEPIAKVSIEDSSKTMKKQFQELKNEAKHVKEVLKEVDQLSKKTPPTVKQWAKKNAEHMLDIILAKGDTYTAFDELFTSTATLVETPTKLAQKHVSRKGENVGPMLDLGPTKKAEATAKSVALGIDAARLAVNIPKTLGEGVLLVCKKAILNEVQKKLKVFKKEHPGKRSHEVEKKIKFAEKWINQKSTVLKQQAIAYGIRTGSYAPRAIKTGFMLFSKVSKKGTLAFAWILHAASLLGEWLQLRKDTKAATVQKIWMKGLEEHPEAMKPIDALLNKRKKVFTERVENNRDEFNRWIEGVVAQKKLSFEEINTQLKAKGVCVKATTKEELKEEVKKDRKALLEQYANYKDTMAVSTRHALKSLALKKQKIHRASLRFKRGKSRWSFSLNTILVATVLILKTIALAGAITLSTLAGALLGFGAVVLGVVFLTVGLIYFYKKRPNTFRLFFKGVNARLMFKQIPLAFNRYKKQKNKVHQLEKSFAANQIRARVEEIEGLLKQRKSIQAQNLPDTLAPLLKKLRISASERIEGDRLLEFKKKLQRFKEADEIKLKKYEQEMTKIKEEVKKLDRRVARWTKSVGKEKAKLMRAGWSDYLRAERLAKGKEGERLDISEDLVKGILVDESYLDEETLQFVKKKLGVDLSQLPKKEMQKALKEYFAIGDTAMIKLIRNQMKAEKEQVDVKKV